MENEVWKPYSEFSFIQVSSIGRVRTLDKVVVSGRGTRVVKGHILKQFDNGHGYLCVGFSVNGKKVCRSVHRLVAQTFLPNSDNLPQVNHKDCDRTDNCVDNLEYCTREYNIQYREKYGVSAKDCVQKLPVYAVSLKTLEVSRFQSQIEASRALGVSDGNLNSVLKGRYKQTGGYWFTNADKNAVEATRNKFDDIVADKVKKLMAGEDRVEQQWLHDFINEMQPA